MHAPDADIPKASQGTLTLLVADAGGSRVVLRHPLEDGGIDDPAFRRLPVRLRIAGLSTDAAEAVSHTLRLLDPASEIPARDALLRALP